MLSEKDKLFIQENLSEEVNKLALRYHSKNDLDYPFLIQQIAGKQKAKTKLPTYYESKDVIFPPQLNLEQSSSEITAKYKTSILNGEIGCDLTGGFGIDTFFLSQKFESFDYVEPNYNLSKIAKQNFKALNKHNINIHNCNAEEFIDSPNPFGSIYIDPSRRTSKGKVVFLEDYEPNMIELQDDLLQKSKEILIKTSPMLDISATISKLKKIAEVHIVAIKNEVKEVLYLLKNINLNPEIAIKTVNYIDEDNYQFFDFTYREDVKINFSSPLSYLYEPNKAIMKSGGYDVLASQHGLSKLNSNSHLYTNERLIGDYQGRIFKINTIKKYSKSDFDEINKANITIRNFPYSVNQIRKKLKIKDGGNIYLFATTDINDKLVILICSKIF